jgi:probable DNA metabolism protein
MIIFRYDHTFEGLLTAVFDAYNRRSFPQILLGEGDPGPLFVTGEHRVITDSAKADRVWTALRKKLSHNVCNMLMFAWLTEEEGVDMTLVRYVKRVFDEPAAPATDFADPDILRVKQLALKVSRERERLVQFTRFQKGGDNTYFAPVKPLYNVLPLAVAYFKDRFRDQRWLVYDVKRHYGFYYDLETAAEVTMEDDTHLLDGRLNEALLAEDERLFQDLWRAYFRATTIRERINPRLQRGHMPRRFWALLTEIQ